MRRQKMRTAKGWTTSKGKSTPPYYIYVNLLFSTSRNTALYLHVMNSFTTSRYTALFCMLSIKLSTFPGFWGPYSFYCILGRPSSSSSVASCGGSPSTVWWSMFKQVDEGEEGITSERLHPHQSSLTAPSWMQQLVCCRMRKIDLPRA